MPNVVGSIPSATPPAPQDSEPTPPKAGRTTVSDRPTRILPTDRVGFSKQLQLLRGYAAIVAQSGNRVVNNPEVAELVGIHQNTSNLAHPFFVDVGFLTRQGTGYAPSAEVVSYGKAFNWNAETAPQKLAPLIRRSWFAQAVLPKLAMGQLSEREVIE